ncbi:enoyl-CoA hydratase-related protein [Nonomuraea sp. NPDC026600]|uniref:enoyl-CoA hydratase/isomerase family protein n=1 Tax=Nonomuraea sp. NPDC026600 TaxID=3155363 RepID=UPI0033C22A14
MGATRVEVAVADGTAWITLDGPERRNALDTEAAADLVAACERIDADATIGAVIITGAGPAFCSGADTAVLDRLRGARGDEVYEGLDELYAAFRRFGALGVPTVAAVNGPAIGAGMNLALAADLRIVSDDAVFVSGFAAIGLHPGGGHLHLIARAGGAGPAAAMGVFGRRVDARRAVAAGLAWAAVPAAELLASAGVLVAQLAADPALARALTATLRHTVLGADAWDRAVEIERARQMWSLPRRRKEN